MKRVTEFTQEDLEVIQHDFDDLFEAARLRCANQDELDLVKKAFDFANDAHKGVRRRSGVPYILHPIAVAKIVVKNIGLGCKSICAALLHDVVEDTDYTVEDLRMVFGEKIASLVDGLTKIKTVLDNEDKAKEKSMQAENFKRILLTLNDDVRVVLIKLADRLHNCRTIEYMPEYKRDKILSETMFVFIPLAHRLGLYEVKSEMEDIWLRYKEPEAFAKISEKISVNMKRKEQEINDFIDPIRKGLQNAGFNFEIKQRIKTPYSIWHKMETKNISFDQVYDLYAVRVVFSPEEGCTESERDMCYHIFSIITGIYRYKPDRVRDWVKHPKPNGYEALHCTLMSNSGIWIEVQIRSKRMNDIAEKGIAAHWAYKSNGDNQENENEMDKWLQKIQQILVSPDVSALELLDLIHNDLTTTDIYVFTPKGEQRAIQKGATALDFAYMIHTHIGNKAIAAKVNMKLVPLSHELHSGDQCEIITTADQQPKREWLDFLVTRKARNIVSDFFREEIQAEEKLRKDEESRSRSSFISRLLRKPVIPETTFTKYILADCCKPISGDPIICFKGEDGSISVHKKICPIANNVASKYGNYIVPVQWEEITKENTYLVRLLLKGLDRTGLLNDISRYVSLVMNVNFREIHLSADNGVFEGYLDLYVHDSSELEKLIKRLSKIPGIQNVIRTDLN